MIVSHIWSQTFIIMTNFTQKLKSLQNLKIISRAFKDCYFCQKFSSNINNIVDFSSQSIPGSQDFKNWHISWIFVVLKLHIFVTYRGRALHYQNHFVHFLISFWSFYNHILILKRDRDFDMGIREFLDIHFRSEWSFMNEDRCDFKGKLILIMKWFRFDFLRWVL